MHTSLLLFLGLLLPCSVSGSLENQTVIEPESPEANYLETRGSKKIIKPIVVISNDTNSKLVSTVSNDEEKLETIFTANLTLLDEQRLCVALSLKNHGSENVYIDIPRVTSRGVKHSPSFLLQSKKKDNTYQYIGPLDIRRKLPLEAYTMVEAGETYQNSYCLDQYYTFDSSVKTIQYSSLMLYYRLISPVRIQILGFQDIVSNVLNIKAR